MKHNIVTGMEVRINDDLYNTSKTHSCSKRMYAIKGMVFKVIGASSDLIKIHDEESPGGERTWLFHPADVTLIIPKAKKVEPVLFDVNNLM